MNLSIYQVKRWGHRFSHENGITLALSDGWVSCEILLWSGNVDLEPLHSEEVPRIARRLPCPDFVYGQDALPDAVIVDGVKWRVYSVTKVDDRIVIEVIPS